MDDHTNNDQESEILILEKNIEIQESNSTNSVDEEIPVKIPEVETNNDRPETEDLHTDTNENIGEVSKSVTVDSNDEDSNSEFNIETTEEVVALPKKKRFAIIDSDSEDEQTEISTQKQQNEADTYTTNYKGELILEQLSTSLKKVKNYVL